MIRAAALAVLALSSSSGLTLSSRLLHSLCSVDQDEEQPLSVSLVSDEALFLSLLPYISAESVFLVSLHPITLLRGNAC